MLIFFNGHPVWKHNPLHGIVLLKVRKNEQLYIGQQNIALHIVLICTENYHHQENGNFGRI
jgi:hypothetical protein